jgi:tetratricopeptide (TPR) repeat protein
MQVLLTQAVELYNYLRRFDDARRSLDRALEVQPDSVSAYSARATIEQLDGKLEAAAAWVARLPSHYSADDYFIWAPLTQLWYERQWDRAAAFAQDALPAGDAVPLDNSLGVAVILGQAQQRAGHVDEARTTFSRIVRSIKPTPGTPVRLDESRALEFLAMAYAGLGDKRSALDAAAQAVTAFHADALSRADAEVTQAMVQAQVGEHEAAIAALPRLLRIPGGLTLGQLKLDPVYDPIRNDPRVQNLLNAPAAARP